MDCAVIVRWAHAMHPLLRWKTYIASMYRRHPQSWGGGATGCLRSVRAMVPEDTAPSSEMVRSSAALTRWQHWAAAGWKAQRR